MVQFFDSTKNTANFCTAIFDCKQLGGSVTFVLATVITKPTCIAHQAIEFEYLHNLDYIYFMS